MKIKRTTALYIAAVLAAGSVFSSPAFGTEEMMHGPGPAEAVDVEDSPEEMAEKDEEVSSVPDIIFAEEDAAEEMLPDIIDAKGDDETGDMAFEAEDADTEGDEAAYDEEETAEVEEPEELIDDIEEAETFMFAGSAEEDERMPEEESRESLKAIRRRISEMYTEKIRNARGSFGNNTKQNDRNMTGVNVGAGEALSGGVYANTEGEMVLVGAADLPEFFDMRNIDPGDGVPISAVKVAPDQGATESCWAYSVTGAGEASASIELRRDITGIDDSETYLVWFAHKLIEGEGSVEYTAPGSGVYVNPFLCLGTTYEAAQLLTSSLGPMNERALPSMPVTEEEVDRAARDAAYTSLSWNNLSYLSDHVVTDVDFLPRVNRQGDSGWYHDDAGVQAIKTTIQEGKAVTISVNAFYGNDWGNYRDGFFRYTDREASLAYNSLYAYREATPDHQVYIVGWDDTVPKEYFGSRPNRQPDGDGAFICRDSQGTYEDLSELIIAEVVEPNFDDCLEAYLQDPANEGLDPESVTKDQLAKWIYANEEPFDESGFFYLSYYDRNYDNPMALTMEKRGGIADEYMYQYDYVGMSNCSTTNQSESSGTVANVFLFEDAEILKHIAVFTQESNSHVHVEVYLLKDSAKNPTDGRLVSSQDLDFRWAGYHVTAPQEPVTIPADTMFSVVVKTIGPTGTPYTPFEIGGIYKHEKQYEYVVAPLEEQCSYILTESGWIDMKDYQVDPARFPDLDQPKVGNAIIRVFTDDAPAPEEDEEDEGDEDDEKDEEGEEEPIPASVSGSAYSPLRLQAKSKKKGSVTLSWKKAPGQISGYTIYGGNSGKKLKALQSVSASVNSYTQKGLKKGAFMTYYIEAYRMYNSQRVVVYRSTKVYAAVSGGKYTNYKSVKVKGKKTVSVKKGKTKQIRASAAKASKNGKIKVKAKLRYESSKPSVATVSKKGIIKAKKKGTAVIRIYAQNGVVASLKVKVT